MAHQQDEEGQPSEAADGIRRDNTKGHDRRGSTREGQDGPVEKKKPNRLAAVIAKLGLDAPTLITMFK
jgi:hypothetical protein